MIPPPKSTTLLFLLLLAILPNAEALAYATIYTANGTYTVPDGVTKVMVEAWGAGSGGCTVPSTTSGGAGGGGAYVRSYVNVTSGMVFNVTVGVAGAGGSPGILGTPSWFNSTTTVYADFGKNSTCAASSAGGAGGSNNIGLIKFNGGAGGTGHSGSSSGGPGGGGAGGDQQIGTAGTRIAGGGGAGIGGNNRGGAGGNGGANGVGGTAGTFPGGGGGSGGSNGGAGAAGANGLVTIFAINDTYNDFLVTVIDENNQSNVSPLINVSYSSTSNATGIISYQANSSVIYVPPSSNSDPVNLKLSTSTYTQRRFLMLPTGTNLSINYSAYLAQGTNNVIFSVVDRATNYVIPSAVFYMIRDTMIAESQYTDVTGSASFDYVPGVKYSFLLTHPSYNSKNFVLDPVIFSTYTIQMLFGSSTGSNSSQDYENVLISYSPKLFYANQTNNFNITFDSITSSFTNFSYNLSYPGGSKGGSSTNPSGATFMTSFNITGGNQFSNANLSIIYTTDEGTKNFTFTHNIIYGPNDGTFIANAGQTYGMGIIDRALVGTIIIIIAAGIISLAVSPIAGLVVALFLMGLFANIGFWEWWLSGISFLIGFIIIIRRTE